MQSSNTSYKMLNELRERVDEHNENFNKKIRNKKKLENKKEPVRNEEHTTGNQQ